QNGAYRNGETAPTAAPINPPTITPALPRQNPPAQAPPTSPVEMRCKNPVPSCRSKAINATNVATLETTTAIRRNRVTGNIWDSGRSLQPLCDVAGVVGEDHVGTGAADAREDFQRHAAL